MSRARFARGVLPLAAAALLLLVACAPTATAAKSSFKGGKYSGKTKQLDVAAGARTLAFTVKKGKVTLTTEPVVRRDLCLSPPVFTLEGATPQVKLNGRGAFNFNETFLGDKIDKIKGRFISEDEVEGTVVYNFAGGDLCSAGATKTTFTAKRRKK